MGIGDLNFLQEDTTDWGQLVDDDVRKAIENIEARKRKIREELTPLVVEEEDE